LLLFGFVLQFAATGITPREPAAARDIVGQARGSMWAGLVQVAADHRLMTIMIGAALVQSSHAMLYVFASLHWRAIGFSGGEIGALWAVSVVGEIILFALAGPAIGRLGARGLLLIGGFGAVARWSLFPFVGDGGVAWTALQLTHAASFAAVHLGTIHVITHAVGNERGATAQGLMVTFSGLAMALATLASGPLYAHFGGAGFLGMAVMAAIGTAVLVGVVGLREAAA
jgi:PPP family 3-phenylpropionic acid transporter